MNTSPETQQEMKTMTAILDRKGWSRSLIKKILGEPDQVKKIFMQKNPAHLYLLSRIEAAEATSQFSEAQERLNKRKASAQKAVATKINNLRQMIQAMNISVHFYPDRIVRKMAIDAYNSWNIDGYASENSDVDFLRRITVNYIRHNLTTYDEHLYDIAGKTGFSEGLFLIRSMIFDKIAKIYPMYEQECKRQLSTRTTNHH